MTNDFFGGLSDVLSQQFGIGDNKLRTLDTIKNGTTTPYGRLGQFAGQFDQSAERQYTEEGMYRNDLFNPKVKQMELWTQQPEMTILVKKRAFSSLAENYRTDLLSKDEQLFIRATKMLFQNKCKQISAYEKLTKIENIATEMGGVDYHILPAIFAAADALNGISNSGFGKFKSVIDQVRTVFNLSKPSNYTNWITNVQNSFKTDLGEGTGVIEFTTAVSVNTTTSINLGKGSFDISFLDPHHLMRVTHNDIEQAIADATNAVFGSSFVQLSLNILTDSISADKEELNKVRARRGANPIHFVVNPDTFLGKRIRAIIDNSGTEIQFDGSITSVTIDPNYLTPNNTPEGQSLFGVGSITGNDGLNKEEEKIFKRIISSTFNSLQINQNSRSVARGHNAATNNLRKKLRLHYGSKLIIQPMDVVHIFVDSKTKVDNKILGGLQDSFNALSVLQTANKTLTNIQDFFSAADNNSAEKAIFVGKDFPTWLWLLVRNQFVRDKSGTQIFCGIVDQSSSNYDSGGTFSVNVSGGDNSSYFKFGVVNYKPALDVWNGSLYDPITPFDIKFDRATGFQKDTVPELLQENKDLFKSVFVKYKNGVYVGKKPSVNNFVQDTERVQNTSTRKVFYDPDGMVYKWKEGIGTLVMFGNNYQDNPPTNVSVPPQTRDPFAGQDIMNVLSLLITGEPYNFATFYKAASQFDNFGRDTATGADPSVSYFRNFQSDIKKRNLLYGNFVPFKSLSVDQETYKTILNNQIRAEGFDRELNDLLQEKADLSDRMTRLGNLNDTQRVAIDSNNIEQRLSEINIKIANKQQQVVKELQQIKKPLSIIGNDISFDYDPSLPTGDKNNLSNAAKRNKELRRRINLLTRRSSTKVRANEDINLFIVDDTYDKDYDIQAFDKSFTNPDLFRSDYVTVDDKISSVKDLIDLEVFADSQGHIQVRAPRYNKIPSSVFYRMLRLKSEFDIQLYPQFIEDLYVNQINNIIQRLEVLEDEIRMYGLALGISTDTELASYLSEKTPTLQANTGGVSFQFISKEDTGSISPVFLQDFSAQDDPVKAENMFASDLEALDSVKVQSKINDILSVSTRGKLLQRISDNVKNQSVNDILSSNNTTTREEIINNRLFAKASYKFDLKQLFTNSNDLLGRVRISQADLLRVLDEVANRISERQKLLKTAANAIKNAKEGLSLIQNKGQIANKLLAPGINANSGIPEVLASIIEDESYDDYGPGSGKRYIIKDQYIKSISIRESKPNHTVVEVQGRFGDNFISNLPQDLNGFAGGGNALTTATAVDYDMWRMYGICIPQSISAPSLTNPETQCAPFAVAMLNKARKEIMSGSIVIFGNEYMQPGEVVYLESQDMLYYVESVVHSFSYGKNFSTTLNVGYGHMPGEYIPTSLDVIGKILYKNRDITNFVSVRDSSVNNEEHVAAIIGGLEATLLNGPDKIMSGTFGKENAQAIRNILDTAENVFSVTDSNYQPTLELRVHYAANEGFAAASTNALDLANTIRDFLLGNNQMFELIQTRQPSSVLRNQSENIVVKQVNSSDTAEFRSPSGQAYMLARRSLNSKASRTSAGTNMLVDKALHDYVVDCWIYFKNNNST